MLRTIIALIVAFCAAGSIQSAEVLLSWKPDDRGVLRGWRTGKGWRACSGREGVWKGESNGLDAHLESPPFELVVGDRDYVELECRVSTTGWVSAHFRGNDVKGICSSQILVRKSDEFQNVRFYPPWADSRKLNWMRFDWRESTKVEIRGIRICRMTEELKTDTAWDLTAEGQRRRVLADNSGNYLKASKSGIAFETRDAPPFVALNGLRIDADTDSWLTVTMSADRGVHGGFSYEPGPSPGPDGKPLKRQWNTFSIRADSRLHTYNIWLGDYWLVKGPKQLDKRKQHFVTGTFEGRMRSLYLVPSFAWESCGEVKSVSIGDKPTGPPLAVIEYAGPAASMYRRGERGPFAVRVRNMGGRVLKDIKIKAQGDEGFSFETAELKARRSEIPPGEVETFFFHGTPAQVGVQDISVSLNAAGADSTDSTFQCNVYPRIDLPRGKIPEPNPLRTPYHIASYYFPGWAALDNGGLHWATIPGLAERRPALGYYKQESLVPAEWDIKWAVEHGINELVVLWYFHNHKYRYPFIENYFLNARNLKHIKFCVMWCNPRNPWWKYDEKDFKTIIRMWIDRYFSHPSYRKTEDGRPVAYVLAGYNLLLNYGEEKAIELMDWADDEARKAGYPGIYWIAAQHGGEYYRTADAELYGRMNIRQFTLYNINGLAGPAYPGYQSTAAEHVLTGAPEVWKRFSLPAMLPVFCGWSSRAWSGWNGSVVTGFTPEKFEDHLRDAKRFLDATGRKDLLIDCWNEWGEGEILAPHAHYGFRMLEAIPKVFAPNETPRPPIVPEDVGMQVPQSPGLWKYVEKPAIEP
ncbi:MAG: glycoside hydrolase family 99-like domain-containing protein [Pirellulales bacterium]|nr:glycoside hydrolase family 99-like domain-containing protein [Pirellulales bacterium]